MRPTSSAGDSARFCRIVRLLRKGDKTTREALVRYGLGFTSAAGFAIIVVLAAVLGRMAIFVGMAPWAWGWIWVLREEGNYPKAKNSHGRDGNCLWR